MGSKAKSVIYGKRVLIFVVAATCLSATSSATAAPPADRTFSHPSEDNQTKNLTLSSGTYTFRTDANPNGYHWVEWYDTHSGGSPGETEHLYYYDDYDFDLTTSGWVRAEVYKSNIWQDWLGWEASYRWYVTVQPPKGNLSVTVKNQNGSNSAAAQVARYTSDWTPIDEKTTNSSGVASWSNISTGNYKLEAYYNGEYWVNDSVTVIAGSTANKTLQRNEPYAYDFKVYDGSTDITGATVISSTALRYEVKVRNSSSVSRAVRVKSWVDRDQSSSYDFYETSSSQSVSSGGGTKTFTFYHTPTSAGTYYRQLEVETSVNNNYLKTDSWAWGNAFECSPPYTSIHTNPTGAHISVDGNPVAASPYGAYWFEAGDVILLTLDGYQDLQYTLTQDDIGEELHLDLIPLVADAAEIVFFIPPTGTLQRGTQATITVRVKNTGTATRSFWVGLSFAHSTATGASWPKGWYDIQPIETSTLSPDQEEDVSFPITIAETWRAGQYYAVSRIWDFFNEDLYLMEGAIDSTLWHSTEHPEWVDNPNSGMLSFSLSQIAIPDDAKTIMDEFELISMLIEGVGIQELYYQGEKPLFLLKASHTFSVYNGITVNVGGGIFVDLADLCELTPEGKDGWTTLWLATEIGGLSYYITDSETNIFEAGVVIHNFDYGQRGIADHKDHVLEVGKITFPGVCITLAKYYDEDGFEGPSWDWSGTKKMGITVLNAQNIIEKVEIRSSYLKAALLARSDLLNGEVQISDYVGYVCEILEDYQNNTAVYRNFTYDDGPWPIVSDQSETNLKMHRVDNSWMNSAHHFVLDVPNGSSNLTFSSYGGIGDLALLWRFGQPVDIADNEMDAWSYSSGTTAESLNIPNPMPGEHYIALSVGRSEGNYDYEGVTFVANLTTSTPILSVTPSNRDVSSSSGTTSFSVSNTGGGMMSWTAEVIEGGGWLTITSGSSGTDSGTITASYTANGEILSRAGKIGVTASDANPTYEDVTVTQAYPDTDGDGFPDSRDNCPDVPNSDQTNSDEDSHGDVCDNCPDNYNPGQEDTSGNGIGNACDCPCYGDLDDNSQLDLDDLQALAEMLLEVRSPFVIAVERGYCGDLNNDEQVDLEDLQAAAEILLDAGSPFIVPCE